MSRSSKQDIRSECKKVMHKLMQTYSIEQISVTQICQAAGISRVTFYNYYDDKYMLLDDFFEDLWSSVLQDYKTQLAEKRPEPAEAFRCFFSSIVKMYYDHLEIFSHAMAEADRNLNVRYYQNIWNYTESLLADFSDVLQPCFTMHETSAFLCTGMLGFFYEISKKGLDREELVNYFSQMIKVVLDSDLFLH